MRCPRCTFPLQPHRADGVVVDTCPRCLGALYEKTEVTTALDPSVELGKLVTSESATMQGRSRLPCPLDHGPLVAYRCEAPDGAGTAVEVDVCPACCGFWLDAGEAHTLQRSLAKPPR